MNTYEALNTKSELWETLPDTAAEMISGGEIAFAIGFTSSGSIVAAVALGQNVNAYASSYSDPMWGYESISVGASAYSW